jgi:hypothetical protein
MAASHTPLSERDLELLSAYLDGALTDRERQALEQRLAHDHALRAELDHLHETVALVHDLPRLKAPRRFTLDPAVYGRKMPWWRRVVTLETALQLSGALGAATSLAIIVLAVVLSSRGTTKKAEVQPAADESAFAITNAQPTSLATLLTAEQTSIAYAGEGLFQATMAMQSTFYAGTPFPSPTAVPSGAAMLMVPAGTPTGAAIGAQVEPQAAPSEETSMADNIPLTESAEAEAPAPLAAGEPSALGGAAAPGVAAPPSGPESETGAVQAPQAAAPAVGTFGEGAANESQATPSSGQPLAASRAGTPTPEPALEQAAIATEKGPSPTPPRSPTASAAAPTATPAPLEIAQAPAGQDAFKAGAERRTPEKSTSRNLWWLAVLGGVMLVVSVGLLMAGHRRARRA